MGTPPITEPTRTATEQQLISAAVGRTVEGIDFSVLDGKRAFLDARNCFIWGG